MLICYAPPWLRSSTAVIILVAVAWCAVAGGPADPAPLAQAMPALAAGFAADGLPRWAAVLLLPALLMALGGGARPEVESDAEWFTAAFQHLPSGAALLHPADSRFFRVNRAFVNLLGYQPEELDRRTLFDLVDKNDREMLRFLQRELMRGGDGSSFELRCQHRDGSHRWVRVSLGLVPDRQGAPAYFVAQFDEYSGQKALEDAFWEQILRSEMILQTASDGFCMISMDGRLLEANAAFAAITGFTSDDLLTMTLRDLRFEQDAPDAHIAEALASGSTAFETVYHRQDGQQVILSASLNLIDMARDRFLFLSIRDVTEQRHAQDALRESEQKSRGIFENSVDGLLLLDEHGHVIEWNAAMQRMSGLGREQALGHYGWDLANRLLPEAERGPARLARIRSWLEEGLSTGTIRSPERVNDFNRSDGETRSFSFSLFPIHVRGTFMIGAIVRDVTELRQAQSALQESQWMLGRVLDSIPTRVFWKDQDLRFLGCNQQFARDAGVESPEAIVGKTDADLVWQEQATEYQRVDRQVIETGQPVYGWEEEQRRLDGSLAWLVTNKIPLVDRTGAVVGVLGTYEDITERKLARDRLAESESWLKGVYNSAVIGIAVLDWSGSFIQANQRLAEMLGYTPGELVGMSHRDVTYPEDLAATRHHFEAITTGRISSYTLEKRYLRKDGSVFWGRLSVSTLRDASGDRQALIGVVADVTERKAAEQAMLASEARYRGLFEDVPISLWEKDYAAVRQEIDRLRAAGVSDFRDYLYSHPDVVLACVDRVRVLSLNRATLAMYESKSVEVVQAEVQRAYREEAFEDFKLELINLAEGRQQFQSAMMIQTLQGRLRYVSVQVTIAPGYEDTWSRVIVSMLDITERLEAELAMRESEARYRGLFEDVPISLWEEDYSAAKKTVDALRDVPDLARYFNENPDVFERIIESIEVLDVNRHTLDLYGATSKADFLGPLSKSVSREEWDALQAEIVEMAQGQHSITLEDRRFINNQWRHVVVNLSIAPGYEETWGRVLISIADITDLKRTQAAEHQQRVLADALRDTAAALVGSLDMDVVLDRVLDNVGRVVPHDAANIALIRGDYIQIYNWRGYSPEYSTNIQNLRIPLDTPTFREMVLTGKPCLVPDIDRAAEGVWCDWEITRWVKSYAAVPVRAHGQVIGFLNLDSGQPDFFREEYLERLQAFADQAAIAIENAQLYDEIRRHAADLQKRVEIRTAELESERAQLQAILDAMGEGVIYSEDWHVRYINDQTQDMLGYGMEALSGDLRQVLVETLKIDVRQLTLDEIGATLQQNGIWRGDVRVQRKDGRVIDVNLTVTLLSMEASGPLSVVTVLRDVSQERALQAQKDRFIANASHELRTPIANMKMRLYLLRKQPERQREHMEVLDYVTRRMSVLVEELLDITRFERGVIRLERQTVDLHALIDSVIRVQQPGVQQQQLRLEYDHPAERVEASVDPGRITQVITNLIANAVNYTRAGGVITVRLRADGDRHAQISVQDTGIGIPPDAIDQIFEPFFRVSEEAARGTGLGLTISREIVQLHGGELSVESTVDGGSTFTVRLPL